MTNDNSKYLPLEKFFDTEETLPSPESVEKAQEYLIERVESDLYDKKDDEVEEYFQQLYEIAMAGHEAIMSEFDSAPPEQVHKLATAAQKYLTTALDASKEKAKLKAHKDKIQQAEIKQEKKIQGDAVKVMADRNELLRQLMENASNEKE